MRNHFKRARYIGLRVIHSGLVDQSQNFRRLPLPLSAPQYDVHFRNVQGITWYYSLDCVRKPKYIDKAESKVHVIWFSAFLHLPPTTFPNLALHFRFRALSVGLCFGKLVLEILNFYLVVPVFFFVIVCGPVCPGLFVSR